MKIHCEGNKEDYVFLFLRNTLIAPIINVIKAIFRPTATKKNISPPELVLV